MGARPVAPPRIPAEIEIAQGVDALDAIASPWREIETAHGVSSPFQSLTLASTAARAHIRAGETPRVVVVRKNGRPLVIFPTVISRIAGVATARFLGDPLIQYGDVIAAPDASIEQIEDAWSAVADPDVVSAVLLRKVRADAKIAPVMRSCCSSIGNGGAVHRSSAAAQAAIKACTRTAASPAPARRSGRSEIGIRARSGGRPDIRRGA